MPYQLERNLPEETPIPEIFYSRKTGSPFTTCLECERSLFERDTAYLIEKAFRRYPGYPAQDTVFEYAICTDCAETIEKLLSPTSKTRITSYMASPFKAALEERQEWLAAGKQPDLSRWTGRCVVKGTPVSEMQEYQIAGYFVENSMILPFFPYAIGEEALGELVTLLSNETLDIINDFSGKHFGLPPEFSDVPRFLPLL